MLPEVEIMQAALAQLTWYHLQLLIDDILRRPHDNPTIGILLCAERDKLTTLSCLNPSKIK